MKLNYVTKIESNLKNYKRIHTKKMTTRILDGSYKSIYKGRSMNFEDIRDYVTGDDIKDIDWKASARNQKLLVRQYTAEKKHNIMLVMDTGKSMLADTDKMQEKREMAILSAGTLAYLVSQNGDYIGATFAVDTIKEGKASTSINSMPFKTGFTNLEHILQEYHKAVSTKNDAQMDATLDYIIKHHRKRMILVIVTDAEGFCEIKEATLKRLLVLNDVLFIHIKSAMLDGNEVFDVGNGAYLPRFFAKDKNLMHMQTERMDQLQSLCDSRIKKYGIPTAAIDDSTDLDNSIIKLLRRE